MNTIITVTDDTIKNVLLTHVDMDNIVKDIDINLLVKIIKDNIPETIEENEFYDFIADYCVSKSSYHPAYNKLASNIIVDKLHKNTCDNIVDIAKKLYENSDVHGNKQPLISDELFKIYINYSTLIDKKINYKRDYDLAYFSIKTLERSYLQKIYIKNKKVIVERPQHMFMRVAFGIHGLDIEAAFETYDLLSQRLFTHASPTLFNAGTNRPQMSSCFLLGIDDNIDSILDQIKTMGVISKWSGGIGVHLNKIRSKGSRIRGTNGTSDGIIPLCILLNKEARYINQGGNRNGSIACFLSPYHADIFDFCDLRKSNSGNDDNRARDLFLSLWIPDLFMIRILEDGVWSLMCPDECPGLESVYGDEFEKLYTKYESENKYKKQIKARNLWKHILDAQMETGLPYICFKDHTNHKSNQQNLGTIQSLNLCAEIGQYSDANETACCNLASICLPMFINNNVFDYNKLGKVTRIITRNLNKVIDINYYPNYTIKHASGDTIDNKFYIGKESNLKHRPMGIGIQGLADVFNLLHLPYESQEALKLNSKIMETIYYHSLHESMLLAKIHGPYKTFEGSPFSKGKLQYHLWGITEDDLQTKDMFDWKQLVQDIMKYGIRNSLLTALMPTASTSQIMGCYESFEPYMSNLFVRTTLAGEFIIINENLMKTLIKRGLWTDDIRKMIIIKNGSIKDIPDIPDDIKAVYKTAFEIKLMSIIDQAVERGKFVDQSQSMNIFMAKPNFTILNSSHFYAWKKGLKTGMYYCRTTSSVNPGKFGIDILDLQRLTGITNVIDLITDEYNISLNKNNTSESTNSIDTILNNIDDIYDSDNDNLSEINKPIKYCVKVPGKIIGEEGCLSCGA
jgi:ribonucleoside-diphosphate reductase alpha chain